MDEQLNQQTADKIKKELYELARNEYITSSMLYQEMDNFLNSLVECKASEDEKLYTKREVLVLVAGWVLFEEVNISDYNNSFANYLTQQEGE